MKKLLSLFLLLLPLAFTACSDDDKDLPDVDITVSMKNVVEDGGYYYVTQQKPFIIDSIGIKGNDGKNAMIQNITYRLGPLPVFYTNLPPFGCRFDTSLLTADTRYPVNITFNVLQVDKTISVAALGYDVVVLKDSTLLPDGKQLGDLTVEYRLSAKKQ